MPSAFRASTVARRLARVSTVWRWALVLVWMGVIFAFSSRSDSGEQSQSVTRFLVSLAGLEPEPGTFETFNHVLRKLAHFSEYAVLGLLFAWARGRLAPRALALAWVFTVAYAVTDEVHQLFVPTRGPSIADVGIDASGAAVALLILWRATRSPR